jgi:hypothetical protein
MTSERHAEFHLQLVRILSSAGDALGQLLSGDDSEVRTENQPSTLFFRNKLGPEQNQLENLRSNG